MSWLCASPHGRSYHSIYKALIAREFDLAVTTDILLEYQEIIDRSFSCSANIPLAAIMKTYVVSIVMFLLAGCTFETHVSGVIVDEKTGLTVNDVLVRTTKDLNGRELEFAESKSSNDGHFDLRFSTKSARDSEASVELSKPGYQTNIYTCHHEKTNDTLVFRRQ